jgi:hypothetical protein
MALNIRVMLRDLAVAAGDDYSQAFKVLGMVVYAQLEGVEPLLAGRLVHERTFFRWVALLKAAGWGDLLCAGDYRRAVADVIATRLGAAAALSPQAVGHQASDAVKGLAGGFEAEPRTLDGVAAGGSLGKAAAPTSGRG